MPSGGVIAIFPVVEGRERELHETLNTLGNDIAGKRMGTGPRVEIARCRTLHFARMAVLPDPDRGARCSRLLLTTDFDGTFGEHVRELIEATSQPEAIWGCCEGYTGPEGFEAFIRRHIIEPDTYYIAFQGARRWTGFAARSNCAVRWPGSNRSPATNRSAQKWKRACAGRAASGKS
jgi:hypothetical protein